MRRERITGDEAKRRVIRYVALMRRDYAVLWQRYRAVVHENAVLHAENDRMKREVGA